MIEKRKIYEAKKGGYTQYILTLPKAFAEAIKTMGVDNLIVIYNGALMAFPENKATANELVAFLRLHPEIEKLLTKEV